MSYNIRQQNSADTVRATLASLGLSEHEQHLYQDLITSGPKTVAVLAKRAGLSRTNGYSVAGGLIEKGICYYSGTRYGKLLHAHPPRSLMGIIQEKRRALQELEAGVELLEELLPASPLMNTSRHTVTYLEGAENIKKIFTLMTMPDVSHIYGVGSELELESYVGYETLAAFHERRKRGKIRFSILRAGPDRLPGDVFHNDDKYLREIRIRPKGRVRLKSQLYLFNNTIVFLNLFDKPFATIIENEPMFVMFHSWFDFIWSASKVSPSRVSQKIKKL